MSTYAIADDLSGAAETAAALAGLPTLVARNAQQLQQGSAAVLELHPAEVGAPETPERHPSRGIRVVDSANRHVSATEAAVRMGRLLAARPKGSDVFLKFDSLLRGNLDAELAAVTSSMPVAFCPALPELGRTVRDGVLAIEGTPLHETNLWQAEPTVPGTSISARLAAASPVSVPLATVRSGDLQDTLARITSQGQLAVCDAETEADLDQVAVAAVAKGIVLSGASALAAAVRRSRLSPSDAAPGTIRPVRDTSVMFILGTASPSTGAQLAALEAGGVPVHRIHPDAIPSADPGTEGSIAVTVDGPVDPSQSGTIVRSLAEMVRRAHAERHLVLSGGETARAVLDALGIRRMSPLAQAHPGAVVSVTADGRLVATRPGSFGGPYSLTQILTTMQALEATNSGKVSL